jgi:hypothetical protein
MTSMSLPRRLIGTAGGRVVVVRVVVGGRLWVGGRLVGGWVVGAGVGVGESVGCGVVTDGDAVGVGGWADGCFRPQDVETTSEAVTTKARSELDRRMWRLMVASTREDGFDSTVVGRTRDRAGSKVGSYEVQRHAE